jgi:hypothetical protein
VIDGDPLRRSLRKAPQGSVALASSVQDEKGVMVGSASDKLCALLDEPDPFDHTYAELEPLWIEAFNERLVERREQIPVLAKLCEASGITQISALDEIIPLLFAHSNYKSYPTALVSRGKWSGMNAWLDTVSAQRVRDLDVEGVADQDEWIQRLHDAGHMVMATSGTSGKNSFLPGTRGDIDFSLRAIVPSLQWNFGVEPKQDRPVFILGPKYGPTRAPLYNRTMAEAYGRPDARFFLTEEPLRISDITRMAALRKAIADGTAMPSDIAAAEQQATARAAQMDDRLAELIDKILEFRNEPQIISGFWPQLWTMLETARSRGVPAGSFHPETVLIAGGGTKGATLPDDYQQQVLAFFGFGQERVLGGYGMSELSAAMPRREGRCRIAPWVIPLILDREGATLLNRTDGETEGRFAFFDIALEGRWGGLISGDHVTADLGGPSPAVLDGSIRRYTDLEGGDDKLTCAGTIDAFVRGSMA